MRCPKCNYTEFFTTKNRPPVPMTLCGLCNYNGKNSEFIDTTKCAPTTDTERLDWMIEKRARLVPYAEGYTVRLAGHADGLFLRTSPREAIDAAMKGEE